MAEYRLPDEVWAMPGRSAIDSLESLAGILRILHGNATELTDVLAVTDDFETLLRLMDQSAPDELERHLRDVERRLFNFVAALHARVDYYRVVVSRGQITGPLRAEYERRVSEGFRADPSYLWLCRLRSYMLHHRLPSSLARFSAGRQRLSDPFEVSGRVVIRAVEMAEDRDFPADVRRWMADNSEIDIRETVLTCLGKLSTFDDWFGPSFAAVHVDDIEAFWAARAQAVHERWPWLAD